MYKPHREYIEQVLEILNKEKKKIKLPLEVKN